jgi:hypothetical protein
MKHQNNLTSTSIQEEWMPRRQIQNQSLNLDRPSANVSRNDRELVLVAKANHLCWAFLAISFSSDCSEAATDPQGYSAPIPIPRKNLRRHIKNLAKVYNLLITLTASRSAWPAFHGCYHQHLWQRPIAQRTQKLLLWQSSTKHGQLNIPRDIWSRSHPYHTEFPTKFIR